MMTLVTPQQAELAIREAVPRLPVESLPLSSLAGKVLRQRVHVSRDQPPFDRVMMDGIAIASDAARHGTRAFRIAATQAAGAPPAVLSDPQACIEVMTGAMLPSGCDSVIPVESLRVAEGRATLHDDVAPTPGLNVHRLASDARAGDLLLSEGVVLGPPEIAAAASAGYARLQVSRAPRLMIVSTGDELREPGEPVEPWQIYRSNIYGVRAALARRGYELTADDHLPDDPAILRERLAAHLETHDALVLSGGVSMGRFDHVPAVLEALGVRKVFHGVAQRPGKPFWFGVRAPDKVVYALPGNPVSTLVCAVRYIVAGLETSAGLAASAPSRARLAAPASTLARMTSFVPVTLAACDEAGMGAIPDVVPRPTRGSGDFVSLLGTHGFVELSPATTPLPPDSVVPFHRW